MNAIMAAVLAGTSLIMATPSAATVQVATASQAADPAELAEARAIIAIMFPPAQRQQMMNKMMDDIMVPMRATFPKAAMNDRGVKAIIEAYLTKATAENRELIGKHFPALLEAMAIAYSHEFSLPELKEVHAFARTPAGSHYLSKSTAIIGDPAVTEVNTKFFQASKGIANALIP